MDKFKLASAVLTACLIVSLLFNVILLRQIASAPIPKKQISIHNFVAQITSWEIIQQNDPNICYATVNFKIINDEDVPALVVVQVNMHDFFGVINEFFKTGENSGVFQPVIRYGIFTANPGTSNHQFSFSFQNPNKNVTPGIEIVAAFPV